MRNVLKLPTAQHWLRFLGMLLSLVMVIKLWCCRFL